MLKAKTNSAREFFQQRMPLYRNNPPLFFREVTGFRSDDWQRSAALDLAGSPKVSVKSGHGVGKTAFEANAILWFLSCFSFARVVATAPTMQQLNDVLWAEVEKWRSRSPLLCQLLTWTKTYVYVNGYEKRWFAVAKTASKPENMQGFHEDNMLIVVDEASGVEDEIMEAILATLSGGNNKLLMCANPTRTSGTFYDSHTRDRAMYKCHTVSSLDSKRTNKDNISAFIRKYGAESNVVKVRVYGEFPTQEDDVYIPLFLIEGSFSIELDLKKIERISIGCDVARYGDDETVIVTNVDGEISMPVIRKGQDLMKTVGDLVIIYRKLLDNHPKYKGKVYVNIDDTGLGGGVTDRLQEVAKEQRLHRMVIVPVNFGGKIPDEKASAYYSNITTYMWSIVRDMLESSKLRLINDDELAAQLSIRKYTVSSNGKIELESKKEMKKRGVGSPDRADALALSCYREKIFDLGSLI
ncbi:MAG: terminase B [Oscillospiraceae bacterium]|nr:terminase B [Oscillospiraceae bacterium]